jgi:class 3 adenylate cyclase
MTLTEAAAGGEVLATAPVGEQVRRAACRGRLRFAPIGEVRLKWLRSPVELFLLTRARERRVRARRARGVR